MRSAADWVLAPESQVLVAGECSARDEDGQGCTRAAFHPLSPHESTGLRAWLQAADEPAIIRCYDAARADELEAKLVRAARRGSLVLFVGAGASRDAPASLPNFTGLTSQIAGEAGVPQLDAESSDVFLGARNPGQPSG
jgi:hypothetical protein